MQYHSQNKITTKLEEQSQMASFQFARWAITSTSKHTIIGIYRPPYSINNQFTLSSFLDEFTNWMADQILISKKIILMGDFNIHINRKNDNDAQTFINTIEALGLQIINFKATHRYGNTLDLIIIESASNSTILELRNGS